MLTLIKEFNNWRFPSWKLRKFWTYKCECWNIKDILKQSVSNWTTVSCGCYQRKVSFRHWWYINRKKTALYSKYDSIIQRCTNKKNSWYKNYWWRWIKCEWNSFNEFKDDMESSYKKWLTLDRIDNDWNYSKKNCRWATMKQQWRNRRSNVMYKWKCITEWCEELNLDRNKIFARINDLGWSIEKSLELI